VTGTFSGGDRLTLAAAVAMTIALAAEPAYAFRPHLGPLPTTGLEVVLVAAIVVGIVVLGRSLPWRTVYTLPAALLLVAATIGAVVSPNSRAAAGAWKAYFVEPMLAGVVVAGLAVTRNRRLLFLAGLGVAGTVAALANLVVMLAAIAQHRFSVVTPPVAIYQSANEVALYLVPLAALGLAVALFDDDRRVRLAAAAFVAIAMAAAVVSLSRAGWLALLVAALFVGAFHRRRLWLVLLPAVVLVALVAGVPAMRNRALVEFSPNSPNNTFLSRLPLWRSALDMLVHRPLLGGGLRGFEISVEPYRAPGYHERQAYPHNILLNFWTETGLLGLAAFLWLCVRSVRISVASLARSGEARMLAIGVMGFLLAFWVHGLFHPQYFKNDVAAVFWAVLAIQVGCLRQVAASVPGPRPEAANAGWASAAEPLSDGQASPSRRSGPGSAPG
jgi:O-antigen ligase